MIKISNFFYFLLFSILLITCAKIGAITGGNKDEDPPKIIKTIPLNKTLNFKENKIKIYFDEFIQLREAREKVIISPTLDPYPTITPSGRASKTIEIKFNGKLKENTTYTVTFSNCIVDNNESNSLDFYKFVFSTGSYLDSLKFKGKIKSVIKRSIKERVSVMIYEIDSTYSDSTIFKKPPTYLASEIDSLKNFELTNISEGKYKLFGLIDGNKDNKYTPKTDEIAFFEETIELPLDTLKKPFDNIKMYVFRETPKLKVIKAELVARNRVQFSYQGLVTDNLKINLLNKTPKDFDKRVLFDKVSDSIHYWFTPFEYDSLIFKIDYNAKKLDTFYVRKRKLKMDSLLIRVTPANELNKDTIKFFGNTPIDKIDKTLVSFKKDTVDVPYKLVRDSIKNEVYIKFEKESNANYTLNVLPGAFEDMFKHKNDTLIANIRTLGKADYSTLRLTLVNMPYFPVIVDLITEKDEVVEQIKGIDKQTLFEFERIKPGAYYIRVIFDKNKNGKWDTGNVLKKIQPEKTQYLPEKFELRKNWDLEESYDFNQKIDSLIID